MAIVLIFLFVAAAGASSAAALSWALRQGQYRDLDASSRVIFDDEAETAEEEDHFP